MQWYKGFLLCIATGDTPPLIIRITTKTMPDTEEIRLEAENNVYTLLMSEQTLKKLAQDLTRKFEAEIKLDNVLLGSIQMEMVLGDLTKLEYLKEFSDKWVLSNIMDSILMTPQFIESCHAEDVAIDVVIDEESYQRVKLHAGK